MRNFKNRYDYDETEYDRDGNNEKAGKIRGWLTSPVMINTTVTVAIVGTLVLLNEIAGIIRFNKKTPLTHARQYFTTDLP